MTYTVIILLPIIIFFLLNEPHDCFVCLGKNPDHIYSIYQLTLEERAIRHMKAKFSKKEQSNDEQSKLIQAIVKGEYHGRKESTARDIVDYVQRRNSAIQRTSEIDPYMDDMVYEYAGSDIESEIDYATSRDPAETLPLGRTLSRRSD